MMMFFGPICLSVRPFVGHYGVFPVGRLPSIETERAAVKTTFELFCGWVSEWVSE